MDSKVRPSSLSKEPPPPAAVAMTVATAISVLGVGKTKLYELLTAGDLQAIRIGRRRLILRESIDALVERLRETR